MVSSVTQQRKVVASESVKPEALSFSELPAPNVQGMRDIPCLSVVERKAKEIKDMFARYETTTKDVKLPSDE